MKKIFGAFLLSREELETLLADTYELGFADGQSVRRTQADSRSRANLTFAGKQAVYRGG